MKLLEPKYFLYADESAVALELPIKDMDVRILGRRKKAPFDGCFLMTKGSPLKKPLNTGVISLHITYIPLVILLILFASCFRHPTPAANRDRGLPHGKVVAKCS